MKSCSTVQGILLSLQECHFNFFFVLLTIQGVILNVLVLCWKAPLLTIEQASCLYDSESCLFWLILQCCIAHYNLKFLIVAFISPSLGKTAVFFLYIFVCLFVTYQVAVVLRHMLGVKIGTHYWFWRVGKVLQESKSVFAETVALKHEINSLAVTWSNGTGTVLL